MKTSTSLRSFLRNIYGYSFFNKLMLISPVYAVFMQDHGMSGMQLSILFILMSVATVGTQVPATYLTNKLGQKNAVLLGQLLKGIAFVSWLVWPTFVGFALGSMLWGTQSAFYNTAYEGLVYDELRARHHNNIYARVLATRYNVQAFGAGLAAFGSLLMFVGYEWITIASLVMLMLSMMFIARIDTRSHGRTTAHRPLRRVHVAKLFKTGFHICRATPCIFLMMMLCLLVGNFAYLDDYLSPIGIEIGMHVEWVGMMQFFILGCMIVGQTFAYHLTKIKDWILYVAVCALGGCFILFAFNYSVAGLWALGWAYVLSSGLYVLLYARFQDFIPPSHRTVILSLYSMGDNIIYVLLCLMMGFGGTLGSWRYSILCVGAMLVGVGVWALLFIGDKCSIKMNPNKGAIKTLHDVGSDIV